MAYVIFDQNSLSGRLEASQMRNLSFLCAFTNNVVKWLNFQQTGQQQKENFFLGSGQIQHIHQCAEHRSNTGGDWKAKSTSNNVAKTGEEEVRTILMSYTYSMRFFFFFCPLELEHKFPSINPLNAMVGI